ncbi:MAG: L,D-transpeptidase, partial [Pontixanthobacter sp.]
MAAAVIIPFAGLTAQSSTGKAPENLVPERPEIVGEPVAADDGVVVSEQILKGIDAMAADEASVMQSWNLDNARALAAIVEGIGEEGLKPEDYNLSGLRAAIAAGANPALDEVARKSFAYLVEDLRDGRTPMDARTQWFVFDPDQDRYPTAKLMADALESGDMAGVLSRIMPQHPDYQRLKHELAKTAAGTAKHKLIRANMDRWRWLARDLGSLYLITNVPEYQLRLTVNDKIIRTYRTVVG